MLYIKPYAMDDMVVIMVNGLICIEIIMMKKFIIAMGNINCIYQVNRGDIILTKLVRKVEWELPGSPKTEMYMYGEASVESNQEMQEPLEKLYQYENQTDIKEQIRDILENLTEYVESHSDNVTNYVNAKDVLEYIDDMWKVFGVDSKKNREKFL